MKYYDLNRMWTVVESDRLQHPSACLGRFNRTWSIQDRHSGCVCMVAQYGNPYMSVQSRTWVLIEESYMSV